MISVDESTVKLVAAAAPNMTDVAPLRFEPVIVTVVPPALGPVAGLSSVTTGNGSPNASTCAAPAEMAAAFPMPCTSTGTALMPPTFPSPSWPSLLIPHVLIAPPMSATLSCEPAEIAVTPESPPTATGVSTAFWTLPLPISPSLSSPQAITVPPESSASACLAPAAIDVTPLREAMPTGTSEFSPSSALASWSN